MSTVPAVTTEGLPVLLAGPMRIDAPTVKATITDTTRAGVFVLVSEHSATGEFEYVGRANSALNERLMAWMNSFGWAYWAYADSARDAYEKECRLFHHINPPANSRHPVAPEGSGQACPACGKQVTQ